MKGDYIDVVACKHDGCDKIYLFAAPSWETLREGSEVIVDTASGNQKVKVVSTNTMANDPNDSDTKFLMLVSGATWPLKRVLSRVETRDLDWLDYEDEENETENLENETEE